MIAKFVQLGEAIDYTPSVLTLAGTVVILGSILGITKLDIPAGKLGAIALYGVYEVAKASGAITAGAALYWDDSNKCVTTSVTDYYFGVATKDAGSGDSVVLAALNVGHPAA